MAHKLDVVISVEVFHSADELSETEKKLMLEAQKATQQAYAPYSGFLVGAALLLEDGSVWTGNNQENAAYPSGLCAERTALFGLRSQIADKKIMMLAVTARKKGTHDYLPAMPCGACRQVLTEYETRQQSPIGVLMQAGNNQIYRCDSASSLLPLQFSKADLGL